MSNRQRAVMAGLVLFLVLIVYHGVSGWGWSGTTSPPAGVAPQTLSYSCGPLWGSGYVHGPATSYPLNGTPCGGRHTYQVLSVIDVILAGAGMAVAFRWRALRGVPAG